MTTAGAAVTPPRVSIVIKALNEEAKIARAIESALAAVAALPGGGEVILADSLSTDRTVEIARAYPIRIAQLADPADRCCGVGAQLGYLVATSAYVYILDGDMEMLPGFLPAALARLEADSRLAGVAGLVEEQVVANLAFQNRVAKGETATPAAEPLTLNMGGLYRRSAIQSVGYLTNRNLHAFEEFELGVRLVSQGWRLTRIDVPAVRHYGHSDATLRLLWRRWRTRYAWGHGELLRSAIGQPHLGLVLRGLRVFRIQLGLAGLWAAALLCVLLWSAAALTAVLALVAVYGVLALGLAWRKRSFAAAAYSLAAWHIGLAGMVRGLLASARGDPALPPSFRVLQ
jgi:glycosyltransferase involved in cell wall biosynthesis